ncbi:hypothetical protein [Streptomyces vietnamensis]|uniref:hypothetical protein n=1 Tax=Streptomyces vietnamensis TaxID=362257 RepID=UPI0006982655|nr:hypothetical protein [Streptomyces vietnamensis]
MGDDPVLYQLRVRGHLGPTLLTAFPAFVPEFVSERRGAETVLTGPVPDAAALYGVLFQCEALGLELLDVHRVRPLFRQEPADGSGQGRYHVLPDRPQPMGDPS